MKYPACFDSAQQYREWKELARLSKVSPTNSYCNDCTPEYQSRMIVEGRCGYPTVRFKTLGKGVTRELIGVRLLADRKAIRFGEVAE